MFKRSQAVGVPLHMVLLAVVSSALVYHHTIHIHLFYFIIVPALLCYSHWGISFKRPST
ncbi:hypothetical protein BJV82DRAFT_363776 [Fennellomyces sp. T-0311]|nr:hypothetical protein BJV82DRAFT_363776 [Fennellomyces sp. T-0311]